MTLTCNMHPAKFSRKANCCWYKGSRVLRAVVVLDLAMHLLPETRYTFTYGAGKTFEFGRDWKARICYFHNTYNWRKSGLTWRPLARMTSTSRQPFWWHSDNWISPSAGAPSTCLPTSWPGPSPSMKSDNWPPSAIRKDGDHLNMRRNKG